MVWSRVMRSWMRWGIRSRGSMVNRDRRVDRGRVVKGCSMKSCMVDRGSMMEGCSMEGCMVDRGSMKGSMVNWGSMVEG